jgi:hypothetical protein
VSSGHQPGIERTADGGAGKQEGGQEPGTGQVLSVCDLTRSYDGAVNAVDGLSFGIVKGEAFGRKLLNTASSWESTSGARAFATAWAQETPTVVQLDMVATLGAIP